ncbi:unnamed protein product [Discosporangium mesarthrocarpum]
MLLLSSGQGYGASGSMRHDALQMEAQEVSRRHKELMEEEACLMGDGRQESARAGASGTKHSTAAYSRRRRTPKGSSEEEHWHADYSRNLLEAAGVKEDGKGPSVDYSYVNKVERQLWKALQDEGYLLGHDEQRLGEYWFDFVYHGFVSRRSEAAQQLAMERGCPLGVIRQVLSDSTLLSKFVAERMEKLERGDNFNLWRPNRGATGKDGGQGGVEEEDHDGVRLLHRNSD